MRWVDIHRAAQPVAGSGPLVEPLTFDVVKAFLRLPSNDDEWLLQDYITSARIKVEEDAGLILITQKWDLFLDAFPTDPILVPFRPLVAVDSIAVNSPLGDTSVIAPTMYQVDSASVPARITPRDGQSWPTDIRETQGIAIRCSCGYGASGATVPALAIQAMRYLIRMWYAPRGGEAVMVEPKWVGYDVAIGLLRTRGAV